MSPTTETEPEPERRACDPHPCQDLAVFEWAAHAQREREQNGS